MSILRDSTRTFQAEADPVVALYRHNTLKYGYPRYRALVAERLYLLRILTELLLQPDLHPYFMLEIITSLHVIKRNRPEKAWRKRGRKVVLDTT